MQLRTTWCALRMECWDSERTPVGPPECPKCKSVDTGCESLSNTRPSLLYTFLIGWIYLLPRAAFTVRAWRCRACGETFKRRSIGSYIALLIVLSLAAWIAVELYDAYGEAPK